jgi:hypothetical protein
MSEMRGEYWAFLLVSGYIINSFLPMMYMCFTWERWQRKAFEFLRERKGL